MKGIQAKTVVISGALGGIGRAIIRAFDPYQVQFLLLDVVEEDAAFFAELKSQVHYTALDLSSIDQINAWGEQIEQTQTQIDFIVHAAGVYEHIDLEDLSFERWNQQINLNLNANYYLIKTLHRFLNPDSAIVNISSIAGHQGSVAHTAYATAKGGVAALTKSLALELAPHTRVNTVSPGLIDTRMMQGMTDEKRRAMIAATPLARLGQPEEIADVILFLCSQAASFITGETIHVNGGLYRQ